MANFRDERLSLANAARLLGVRASDLKHAIQQETLLRGTQPPAPMYKTAPGGWVFRAGDVMDAAKKMSE